MKYFLLLFLIFNTIITKTWGYTIFDQSNQDSIHIIDAGIKEIKLPENELYITGIYYFADGNYTTALEYLTNAQKHSPFSKIDVNASILTILIHYLENEKEKLNNSIYNFQQMYPKNENIPYLLFLQGNISLEEIQNYKRDLGLMNESLLIFNNLLISYPNSKFATQSIEKIEYIHYLIQRHYFYEAELLEKRNNFIAAIIRYNKILEEYSENNKFTNKEIKKETEKKLEKLINHIYKS